jgi:hypothetical protein
MALLPLLRVESLFGLLKFAAGVIRLTIEFVSNASVFVFISNNFLDDYRLIGLIAFC